MQHPFLQKFLRNNGALLPHVLALVVVYLLARGLFFGAGAVFFVGVFFIFGMLCGALANAIYGRLPPYFPSEQEGWKRWQMKLFYRGKTIETPMDLEIRVEKATKKLIYLLAAFFILGDINTVLSDDVPGIPDGVIASLLFLVFWFAFGMMVARMGMARFYNLREEVRWIKCVYLFFLFLVSIAGLLFIFEIDNVRMRYIVMGGLAAVLMNVVADVYLMNLIDKMGYRVKYLYLSVFSFILIALLSAIFIVEERFVQAILVLIFVVFLVSFVLCALYLVRGNREKNREAGVFEG